MFVIKPDLINIPQTLSQHHFNSEYSVLFGCVHFVSFLMRTCCIVGKKVNKWERVPKNVASDVTCPIFSPSEPFSPLQRFQTFLKTNLSSIYHLKYT